jgi:hypothetical protein
MKANTISLIALAIGTATGVATAQIPEYSPLTHSEQFREYLNNSFGLEALGHAAAHAEISQLSNSPNEWGQGTAGYGARFGSTLGRHVIRQTLKYGASSLLHEDTRYVLSGKKGFWRRTEYAVASSFLARHPNGRRGFAFASVGSAGGAAFIARAWLPRSVATLGAGASSFGLSIAADVGSNVVREFWPELKRRFRRK